MNKTEYKIGKVFLVFAGICIITIPLVVLLALSFEPEEKKAAVLKTQSLDFDYNGSAIFESYNRMCPPVPLADFLGALSVLLAKDVLRNDTPVV